MRSCTENYSDINGTKICWFEWGQPVVDQASIILVHATGFHARCWDQTIVELDKLNESNGSPLHIIAVDQRGHGRSGNEGTAWDANGRDIAELICQLKLPSLIAVGHSMGGHCLVHAMMDENVNIKQALLVDPVLLPPENYQTGNTTTDHSQFLNEAGLHPVARRKNHFASPDAMFENFKGRGSYAAWLDAALHDYCQYGLLPAEDGEGFNLACPPDVEASIYMSSVNHSLYDSLDKVTTPVTILRAQRVEGERKELNFNLSPTWPGLAAALPNATDVYLPDLTHFMPMQAPELVAQYIMGLRS